LNEHETVEHEEWIEARRATIPDLAEPDEPVAFASRDHEQAAVAELLGFSRI
jgi:hypothetical protein